jgi:long-chain acyl-CoA synthetase
MAPPSASTPPRNLRVRREPVPDEMMGEKVGAVLVPAGGGRLDINAVLTHCKRHLADFKVPQHLDVRDQPLPRSPIGKVLKGTLRVETTWTAPLR